MRLDDYLKKERENEKKLLEEGGIDQIKRIDEGNKEFLNLLGVSRKFADNPAVLSSLLCSAFVMDDFRQAKTILTMLRSMKIN